MGDIQLISDWMGPLILTWIVLIFSVVVLSTAPGLPNKAENGGEQQPNKPSGPGLWNSIGESIKTPGEAMPTQIHLPHGLLYDHPAMLDGSQKGDLKRRMMKRLDTKMKQLWLDHHGDDLIITG